MNTAPSRTGIPGSWGRLEIFIGSLNSMIENIAAFSTQIDLAVDYAKQDLELNRTARDLGKTARRLMELS